MAKFNGQEIFFPSLVKEVDSAKFKMAIVEKNEIFEIKPGMIAIVFPWDKSHFYKPNDAGIITNGGTSIVFATDLLGDDYNVNDKGTQYSVAIISISGITSRSSHDTYSIESGYCYFKNYHTDTVNENNSGYAYVYYLER